MNQMPHGAAGHQQMPATIPYHEQSRRQQQYHNQMYNAAPHSPIHANGYGYHHAPPPFYPHAQPSPQTYARWHQMYAPSSYGHMPQVPQVPPPMPHYPPRSPMVVSSHPYSPVAHTHTASTYQQRPVAMHALHSQQSVPASHKSPALVPQAPQSSSHGQVGLPSPAPTPPAREELSVGSLGIEEDSQEAARLDSEPERVQTPPVDSRRASFATAVNPLALPPQTRAPFYPKLPWYSPSATPHAFPPRARGRRRQRQDLTISSDSLALPHLGAALPAQQSANQDSPSAHVESLASETSTIPATSNHETPATSRAPSESDSKQSVTPNTNAATDTTSPMSTPTRAPEHARRDTRSAIAVPNIPTLHKPKSERAAVGEQQQQAMSNGTEAVDDSTSATSAADKEDLAEESKAPSKPAPPKSWADLVRAKNAGAVSGAHANGASNASGPLALPKSASLAEALRQYTSASGHLQFLKPRGLVNTGNMCYMNSILQVLVFCTPFYDFLDQVRQRTAHSMKSSTPLVDAMIMFMQEFQSIASEDSSDALRQLLSQQQLEQYGEPVTPEYVYDAIRRLPRFQGMRRGHQQDAEEFLGFLLEGLHDECVEIIQSQAAGARNNTADSNNTDTQPGDGWMEVGPKQRSAETRTAGHQDIPSPITKIFGGNLRSELRIPGRKDSVTLEPYKPLQLDIGASHVNNILDALKALTRTEALIGDFGGRGDTAKKQVFIDTLPPVLILHLKRFQYENSLGGTQKIWKKVGYPLELEIPKDVFPVSKRGSFAAKGGLPRYRLISVVYHHGKSAAGGHYTVDVLRQDSREWIRMDDTVIRRIRPQDVAEGGSEEDPKLLAKALEQHKADQELQSQKKGNMFEGLDDADADEEHTPWRQVNGQAVNAGKRLAQSNGTATPSSEMGKKTPNASANRREGVKDNKVAYILLYERIRS